MSYNVQSVEGVIIHSFGLTMTVIGFMNVEIHTTNVVPHSRTDMSNHLNFHVDPFNAFPQ